MMCTAVLSDRDIQARLKEGSLRIDGYTDANLTPNGYDVTVDEIWVPATNQRTKEGALLIQSGSWFVVATREYLELPDDLVAEIWIRTSWARKGIIASFGRIDAGFHGNLTFSALNASPRMVEIAVGDRFAQIVFEELTARPEKSYSERSGNYHGQRGITLEPLGCQRN